MRYLSERRCFTDPLTLLGDFRQEIDRISVRLDTLVQSRIEVKRRKLLEISNRLVQCSPQAQLVRWRERLHRYADALRAAIEVALEQYRRRMDLLVGKLEALSPFS
ncbi:exodeoxyribonuclease VII large subunit, partial [Escherichia coli]|uniref:exodeoxyribonuclease VII large subunit n=1 Tax=Escherichia coli TaxID=562 RepID=UPI0034D52E53